MGDKIITEKFAVSSGGGRLFFAFRLSVRRISISLSDTVKSGNAERFPPSGREVAFLPKAKKTEGARRPVIEFEETYDEWDEGKTSPIYKFLRMISRVAGLPQSRFARQLPPGGSDFARRYPRWELRLPQALCAFAMTCFIIPKSSRTAPHPSAYG